ncbi:MAG: hypothetical protein JO165_09690 [Candidatus Eremiobacteraeota bacterium]|nr:hypothetical protein [Candidatus Eremiobacteraeota bacterium]
MPRRSYSDVARFIMTRGVTFYVALLCAALYTASVCAGGIPSLRHDWWWPIERWAFFDLFIHSTSGWLENGIGSAYAFPSAYMIGTILAAVGFVVGPYAALMIYVFTIGSVCAFGARALAMNYGARAIQVMAAEVFAIFNPWVYAKTVAGHTYMLLAYGALFGLVAHLMKRRPNTLAVSLLLLLTMPQLQLFLVASLAVLVRFLICRDMQYALATSFITGLPLIVGGLLDRNALYGIPYTLAWERMQSVNPVDALTISGDFTHYTAHFLPWQTGAVWLVACAALLACALSTRRVAALATLLLTLAIIALSTGVRGPFPSAYEALVVHVPQSGLFRELFDLVGLAAVGYVALIALQLSKIAANLIGGLALTGAIACASGWLIFAPYRYWVDSRQIPLVSVIAPQNTRFALLPPLQPLMFGSSGSGLDRDAFRRSGDVTPLNESLATYPANAAFSRYLRTGSVSDLEALSVAAVIDRPWMRSDVDALAQQMTRRPEVLSHATKRDRDLDLHAMPELTVARAPALAALASRIGAGNIFFGDAKRASTKYTTNVPRIWTSMPQSLPITVSNRYFRSSDGWTDVRFAYFVEPEFAQGLGGAITTNSDDRLEVRPGLPALVYVRGILTSAGGPISGSTVAYKWVTIPHSVRNVQCEGTCVVAAQADFLPPVPLNPTSNPWVRVSFTALTPFIVSAHVRSQRGHCLRYNVRYDDGWVALARSRPLPHIRIDAAVNGWLFDQNANDLPVLVIHVPSVLQAIGEVVGVLWLILLIVHVRRDRSMVITRS